MLIGILSDSHGRVMPVRRAVAFFDQLDVLHIIHCGDIGGREVFDELAGRPCTFVWGNMDLPDRALLAYLDAVGMPPPSSVPALVTLDGKRFAVFHGHEDGFAKTLGSLDVDFVLHGHTHVAQDSVWNGKRVINPGALHRARPKTVATLDTATDELAFHVIQG